MKGACTLCMLLTVSYCLLASSRSVLGSNRAATRNDVPRGSAQRVEG